MYTVPSPLDPMKFFAASANAMLTASKAAQDSCIETFESLSKHVATPFSVQTVEVPFAAVVPAMDETRMRDAFQTLADANLRNWEHVANMLATAPEWARWPYETPGAAMTDFFDRLRRRTTELTDLAANDRGEPKSAAATAAEMVLPAKRETAPKPEPVKDRPTLLEAPQGEADDLTQIKGVGPKLSSLLNTIGVYHYWQVAEWSKADGEWIDEKISFKGRVAREKWVQQARKLAKASAA